jgi:hypothetical protein
MGFIALIASDAHKMKRYASYEDLQRIDFAY